MTVETLFSKVAVAMDEAYVTDYIDKIYQCIDSVQREVSAFVWPIVRVTNLEVNNGEVEVPVNCYEVLSIKDKDGCYVSYSLIDETKIKVNLDEGVVQLKYNSFPISITNNTPVDYSLELPEHACEAVVYGVCAGLCINDEPALYSAYMARYNSLLDSIVERSIRFPKGEMKGGIHL